MRVMSGIQPTGTTHLGNYFGAFANWVKLQNEGHECFYSIANQHALTLPQDPIELRKNTLVIAATMFAVGLDPNKSTIFVQSDVPEHTQLAWILSCLAPLGQMERMIQFKEKTEKNPSAVNFGLLSYPILQAADILLYKAELVPVGKDQAQHLELTRILAKKFNETYKELFPLPETLHTTIKKVVGLDGSAKMSKSLNNYISLTQSKESIWEKLRPAVTDPARITKNDPGNPFICNIYSLHKLLSSEQEQKEVVKQCQTAGIGCIDCKKILYNNLIAFLTPIKKNYDTWMTKPEEIKNILVIGAQKAQKVAQQTLNQVNKAIGLT